MTQNIENLAEHPLVDEVMLDRLMNLSGELVIIRSQYARIEKLLQQDIFRQKEVLKGLDAAKSILEVAIKEPNRAHKTMGDLVGFFNRLGDLAKYDAIAELAQSMGHTTSDLEKISSELQSGIVKLKIEATGGQSDSSLAMAIVPALLVVVGQEICAFPLSAITEIINVSTKNIYKVDGNSAMKLRDHALSLIELSKIIQLQVDSQANEQEIKRVVVIADGNDKLGVIVDSLLGKDQIVFKHLTKHFVDVQGVAGASILADGNVAIILDPAAIIKASK